MPSDTAESIAKNTSYMMGSQAVTWLSGFVLMMLLPRYLGSEAYGKLYLAISITMICQTLITFGAPYYITKEVARSPETTSRLVVNSIALRIMLWLVSIGAVTVFAYEAGYPRTVIALILIFGTANLWGGANGVLVSCFQGFELMQYPSLGAVAERLFAAALCAAALLLGADVVVVAVILAVSTLLNFLVVTKFTPLILSSLPRWKWTETVDLMKAGAPYFLWSIFAVIYYRVDAVMLSLLAPASVVGWYGAAYRFFDVLMFLPSIFSVAIFPILSRLGAEDRGAMNRTTQKSLEYLIMAGIPISIAVFAFAEPVVSLLFGLNEYRPSVLLIRIFAVALPVLYADFVLGSTLFASDRQRQWAIVAFLALLLNPGLNYFMIPYTQASMGNGGIGAAVATLLTEGFIFGAALYFMPRGFLKTFRGMLFLKVAGAGAMMAGTIWLLRAEGAPWIVQCVAGPACYAAALMLVKGLEPAELEFIRRFASPRNLKGMILSAREVKV